MKQFKTMEEFNLWLEKKMSYDSIEEMLYADQDAEIEKLSKELMADGYNLDDLVADGHAYEFAGHSNNGWLWEDEEDPLRLENGEYKAEIRRRQA